MYLFCYVVFLACFYSFSFSPSCLPTNSGPSDSFHKGYIVHTGVHVNPVLHISGIFQRNELNSILNDSFLMA